MLFAHDYEKTESCFRCKNLLQKKDKLLGLLEASAAEGQRSARALIRGYGHLEQEKAAQDLAHGRLADTSLRGLR